MLYNARKNVPVPASPRDRHRHDGACGPYDECSGRPLPATVPLKTAPPSSARHRRQPDLPPSKQATLFLSTAGKNRLHRSRFSPRLQSSRPDRIPPLHPNSGIGFSFPFSVNQPAHSPLFPFLPFSTGFAFCLWRKPVPFFSGFSVCRPVLPAVFLSVPAVSVIRQYRHTRLFQKSFLFRHLPAGRFLYPCAAAGSCIPRADPTEKPASPEKRSCRRKYGLSCQPVASLVR